MYEFIIMVGTDPRLSLRLRRHRDLRFRLHGEGEAFRSYLCYDY